MQTFVEELQKMVVAQIDGHGSVAGMGVTATWRQLSLGGHVVYTDAAVRHRPGQGASSAAGAAVGCWPKSHR